MQLPKYRDGIMVDLVKMKRGDKTADVHPNEVDNMKSADWVVCEQPKKTVKRTPSRAKVKPVESK